MLQITKGFLPPPFKLGFHRYQEPLKSTRCNKTLLAEQRCPAPLCFIQYQSVLFWMWRGRNTTEGERRRTTARSQYHEVKQIKRKANKQVILILVTERFTYGDVGQHICKLMRVRSQQRGQTISSLIFKFFCCVLLSGPSPVQPLIVHVDLFYLADGSF